MLLLRLWEGWEAAGCGRDWAREHGLDLRGMNFARDIRRQLEGGYQGGGGGAGSWGNRRAAMKQNRKPVARGGWGWSAGRAGRGWYGVRVRVQDGGPVRLWELRRLYAEGVRMGDVWDTC